MGIPSKRDPKCLPGNYDMAVKRMTKTERKLLWDVKTANEYNQTTEGLSTRVMLKFWRKILKLKARNGIFHTLQSLNQIKEQQRQELYLTLLQLKMVQV